MNYSVDWYKLIIYNVPRFLRQKVRVQWLTLLLSQIRKLHADLLVYIQRKRYDLNHTGQVIYLEKVLNDQFDPTQRRIFISDGDFGDRVFLDFRPQADPLYFYWRWNVDQVYQIEDQVQENFKVHQSNNAHQGVNPTKNIPPYWVEIEDAQLLKVRQTYITGAGFIINVPASLQFNQARMIALVDFYKVAARQYKIIPF